MNFRDPAPRDVDACGHMNCPTLDVCVKALAVSAFTDTSTIEHTTNLSQFFSSFFCDSARSVDVLHWMETRGSGTSAGASYGGFGLTFGSNETEDQRLAKVVEWQRSTCAQQISQLSDNARVAIANNITNNVPALQAFNRCISDITPVINNCTDPVGLHLQLEGGEQAHPGETFSGHLWWCGTGGAVSISDAQLNAFLYSDDSVDCTAAKSILAPHTTIHAGDIAFLCKRKTVDEVTLNVNVTAGGHNFSAIGKMPAICADLRNVGQPCDTGNPCEVGETTCVSTYGGTARISCIGTSLRPKDSACGQDRVCNDHAVCTASPKRVAAISYTEEWTEPRGTVVDWEYGPPATTDDLDDVPWGVQMLPGGFPGQPMLVNRCQNKVGARIPTTDNGQKWCFEWVDLSVTAPPGWTLTGDMPEVFLLKDDRGSYGWNGGPSMPPEKTKFLQRDGQAIRVQRMMGSRQITIQLRARKQKIEDVSQSQEFPIGTLPDGATFSVVAQGNGRKTFVNVRWASGVGKEHMALTAPEKYLSPVGPPKPANGGRTIYTYKLAWAE